MADPEIVDDNEQEEVKKPSGSNNTLILIIVAVLAVLMAIGGAFFMVNMLTKSQSVEESEDVKSTLTEDKTSKKTGSKSELGELYSFERAVIVNLAETNAERYLKVDIVLELDSPKLTKEIESRLPQIQDLLINVTSTKTLEDVSTTSGRNMLRQEMIDKINSLLSTGQITNVYFTEFVVQ